MYIIDESYFIKELTIPTDNNIDVAGTSTPFEAYIDQEARLLLQSLLGSSFGELDAHVVSGLYVTNGSVWDAFVLGTNYTKNGKTYIWKGLIYEEGVFLGSLMAYWVYSKWLEFQLSQQTGMGEAKGNAINSMGINATHRYVSIWNKFITMYQGDITDTDSTLTIINGVPFVDYFGGDEGQTYVSCVKFLKDNIDDYRGKNGGIPPLKLYEAKNTLGI